MSAVSFLEASIVLQSRKGDEGVRQRDNLAAAADLSIISFDRDQAMAARAAFANFGKGRHKANLNFGDCAAYALAATMGASLLFKGDDFASTGIQPV